MAYVERHIVTITTDAQGAGEGFTPAVTGFVQAIRYVKPQAGGYAAGVDIVVTAEDSGLTIWDEDDVDASVTVYPRAATADTAGVASLYAAGGEPVETPIPVARERIKIAVAAGGAAGVGTFHVYVG
jgi:hypothetical protein